jgi:uncharacterized protein (TIGR00251 family)
MADGTLRVKIAAAPEKGKANDELRRLLAKTYNVRLSDVEILSGLTSPLKRVRVGPA